MSKIEFTVAIDATNGEQLIAVSNFLTSLAALQVTAPTKVQSTLDAKVAETVCAGMAAEADPAKEEPKAAPAKRSRSKAAAKPEPETEEESPAAEAAKEEDEPAIKVETLRSLLSQKVDSHRDVIKDKLTGYGTKNITGLDPKHYQEMYDFLSSLD